MNPATSVSAPTQTNGLDGVRRSYLDALLAGDSTYARNLVASAADRGATMEEVYFRVLAPVMDDVGALWSAGELSVAHEHYATAITSGVMHTVAPRWRRPPTSGRLAIVACTPGERHSLGSQMVADFLEAAGWEVLALGPDVPVADLATLAELERPDVVALSTGMREQLPAAAEALDRLNGLQPRAFLVVGGRAWFDVAEPRARELGADARIVDPAALVGVVQARFPALADDVA